MEPLGLLILMLAIVMVWLAVAGGRG